MKKLLFSLISAIYSLAPAPIQDLTSFANQTPNQAIQPKNKAAQTKNQPIAEQNIYAQMQDFAAFCNRTKQKPIDIKTINKLILNNTNMHVFMVSSLPEYICDDENYVIVTLNNEPFIAIPVELCTDEIIQSITYTDGVLTIKIVNAQAPARIYVITNKNLKIAIDNNLKALANGKAKLCSVAQQAAIDSLELTGHTISFEQTVSGESNKLIVNMQHKFIGIFYNFSKLSKISAETVDINIKDLTASLGQDRFMNISIPEDSKTEKTEPNTKKPNTNTLRYFGQCAKMINSKDMSERIAQFEKQEEQDLVNKTSKPAPVNKKAKLFISSPDNVEKVYIGLDTGAKIFLSLLKPF